MKDKIIRIKLSRLKPEELFLINILNDIEIRNDEDLPNIIYWDKDCEYFFKLDYSKNKIYCSRKKVWDIIIINYGYGYSDAQSLIKNTIERQMKLFGLTVEPYGLPSYTHFPHTVS